MAPVCIPALIASAVEGRSAVSDSDEYAPCPLPERLGINLYEEVREEEE